MREIFERIREALERGESGALITITRTSGSTPRKPGAKMLLLASGEVVGTIGGGCVEAEIWQEAREVMKTGQPRLVVRGMAFGAPDLGRPHSGTAEMFVEPI